MDKDEFLLLFRNYKNREKWANIKTSECFHKLFRNTKIPFCLHLNFLEQFKF